VFHSREEAIARRADVSVWGPTVQAILERHGLPRAGQPVAGHNPTFPTFVVGEVVVKLFGLTAWWRRTYETERTALTILATERQIRAPRLLGEGWLADDPDAPWPYLVMTRIPGVKWSGADLSTDQRVELVAELGRQVERIHALVPAGGLTTDSDWSGLDVRAACTVTVLPAHLVEQIADYLARLGPSYPVFLHGDMVAMHVFVDGGRLAGIIDWGDAMVTDRHSELIKLMDVLEFDKSLLRVFLEASAWPVGEGFARQAMGYALIRQALLLAQHHSSDAFWRLPTFLPLDEIQTLDELAEALFGV
jgi:aminoglycoside phosphotransferase (APT) family kinase protein